jgi:hypothetical protein
MKFEPDSQAYSPLNALFLGDAAHAAYGDGEAMKRWARDAGFTECYPFAGAAGHVIQNAVEGFIAKSPDVLLIAFRGTDPRVGDWFHNFRTLPVASPWTAGRVHQGFRDALESVWHLLESPVSNHGGRNLWITGHSLGGALAVACAARAQIAVQGVYTYGQPRFGDDHFAESYLSGPGARTYRHVHERDLVPQVPLFTSGFRHAGAEIFIGHDTAGHARAPFRESSADIVRRIVSAPRVGLAALVENVQNLLGAEGEDRMVAMRQAAFQVATDHLMGSAYLPFLRKQAERL